MAELLLLNKDAAAAAPADAVWVRHVKLRRSWRGLVEEESCPRPLSDAVLFAPAVPAAREKAFGTDNAPGGGGFPAFVLY